MKKAVGFLCCTLLLGIVLLSNTEGELPLHWFQPFLRVLPLQTTKAVVKGNCLVLFDVKWTRENITLHCPKVTLHLKKSGIVCYVDQAAVTYGTHVFSNVCGVIQKHSIGYKAILKLKDENVSNVQIVCDSFSQKLFKNLWDTLNSSKTSSRKFFAQALKIHISGKHVFWQIDTFNSEHLYAKNCCGILYIDGTRLKCSQKAELVKYNNIYATPVNFIGVFDLKRFIWEQAFVQTRIMHEHLGSTTIALVARGILSDPIPAYVQLQNDAFYAEMNLSNLKHLEVDNGFAKCTSDDLLKKWEWFHPYRLSFQHPLYLKFQGNKQHLSGVLDAKDMIFETNHFHRIHSTFEIAHQRKITWDARFYADEMQPWIFGFYDLHQKLGELHYTGHIAPELTYSFKHYLPDWWESFFKQFCFHKSHPYTDFSLAFNANDMRSLCFGYVSAKDAHFKQSHIEQLHMNFGNCPGYCWLRMNDLKMHQRNGACEIHWPYEISNPQRERWLFKGNGGFEVQEWVHLLEDFIGKNETFEILKHFSPTAEVQSQFEGVLSSEPYPKEYLTVCLKMPKGKIWDFPVSHFSADYVWDPHATHVKNIQAKLLDESPIVAHISCEQEQFDFQFEGEHITTKSLFDHPMIYPWIKSIPKDNLENYDGILNLNLQGQGKYSSPITVSGHGHLEFQNPNLSQIHLLGPLTHLFEKKLRWHPVISLNKLISEFAFTEKQISTQKSTLLGPSTRADLRGHIDIPQQKIQGEIHFSFLDYKQLNFPIMKHFLQIFQPLSKGFSAKIFGTFGAPRWSLSFNPFRFVLPQ